MAATAQPTLKSGRTGRNPVVVARMPAGVELRSVASLVAYDRNPRTHSSAQVAQIAASITEFGFTNPVLITGAGQIIAGHGRVQSTVWHIDHTKSETGHSTQKPVECMRRPMLTNSKRGEAVYEPFAGSGTSIIAAESIGRRCYAIELSPIYCDLIVRRWQAFAHAQATLEGTDRSFADIEAERAAAAGA